MTESIDAALDPTSMTCIDREAFRDVAREIFDLIEPDVPVEDEAMEILHKGAEAFIVQIMGHARYIAEISGNLTVCMKHWKCAVALYQSAHGQSMPQETAPEPLRIREKPDEESRADSKKPKNPSGSRKRRRDAKQSDQDTNAVVHDRPPGSECIVCMEGPRQVMFRPCGHFAVCKGCAEKLRDSNRCPICRAAIVEVVPCILS